MAGKKLGGKGAQLTHAQPHMPKVQRGAEQHAQSQSVTTPQPQGGGLSAAQRERFYAARQELAPRIQPQVEAIEMSEKLRHEDLTIRINSRD